VSPLDGVVAGLSADLAAASEAATGRRVSVRDDLLTERAKLLGLAEPGAVSANGSCRMVRARDGWLAVNLPRDSDLQDVPAWIGCDFESEPWPAITAAAADRDAETLVEDAQRLGLPVARVGAVHATGTSARLIRMANGAGAGRTGPLRVLDLSSLWAGPLAAGLLAEAGCEVTKVESLRRPDTLTTSSRAFFDRLNGSKTLLSLDFADPAGLSRLAALAERADVLVTGARPRAFAALGLAPQRLFAANPGLVWVAITGYGWDGPLSGRVAFGDDAAAAGGLARWTPDGPWFLGDALADPLTGVAAAIGAFRALAQGGGVIVDAAMARIAAGAAAKLAAEATA
jgi:hypothetical protein